MNNIIVYGRCHSCCSLGQQWNMIDSNIKKCAIEELNCVILIMSYTFHGAFSRSKFFHLRYLMVFSMFLN